MDGAPVNLREGLNDGPFRLNDVTFWKFLTDVNFTSSPSKLTEDELLHMGRKAGRFEHEIEAVLRGYREMLKNGEEG